MGFEMRALLFLAGLAMATVAGSAVAAPVKVALDTGVVVGSSEDGVNAFRGIPFAAPPVGPLRWAPPKPAAPWSGEREALHSGPSCLQPIKAGQPNEGGVEEAGSEDCLTLQVFAPTGARGAPVMVWLYGGGNSRGASSLGAYDGGAFARDGVILVAVNYRLGNLGFFAHPALTKAAGAGEPLANYGIMDQIAGLKWVQRNIKAFGGDPANVTVFGESAGGQDTLALLSIPSTKGLFAKAIVESGGGWNDDPSLTKAETAGEALATKLGAPAGATAEQLRAIPAAALIAATGQVSLTIDGRLMVETPTQAFARGHAHDVPLMIGSNSWEASLVANYIAIPGGPAGLIARQPASVKPAYAGLDEKDAAADMFTDAIMGGPARWIAGKAASGAPSYLYYFSYVPESRRGKVPGAGHATEIPFVFASWSHLGKLGEGVAPLKQTLDETAIIHGCWVSFAKHGRPEKCAPGGWPAYDPAKDELYEFGLSNGVRTNWRKPQLDAQEAARADLLSGK
jgi:para-nitrobenzyl esterase